MLEPSCSYTECIDRKKSQEACSTTMVLQPPSRTLLEGTWDPPRPQTCCSQQDVAPWDTWVGHVFQTAPKPAALHPFHPAQPAWFPLLCSALPCPITSQVHLASSFWPEHSFPSGWCCGVVSAMTLLAQYTRGRHTGNRTMGPTAAETSLAFALCCGLHNAVILRSRCCLTIQLMCWQ